MFKYVCSRCGAVLYESTYFKPVTTVLRVGAFAYMFDRTVKFACPVCLTVFDGRGHKPVQVEYPIPATEDNQRDAEDLAGFFRDILSGVNPPEPKLRSEYGGVLAMFEYVADKLDKAYTLVRYRRPYFHVNALNAGNLAVKIIGSHLRRIAGAGGVKADRLIMELFLQVGDAKPAEGIRPGYIYVNEKGFVITPAMFILYREYAMRILKSSKSLFEVPVLDYYEVAPGRLALRLLNANPLFKVAGLGLVKAREG